MFVIGNFLFGLASVLNLALRIYFWIVIARAVLSWVNPDPYNPIVRFLYRATEPLLNWIRRRLPVSFGGIDFAPMVVILGIIFLQTFLIGSLQQIAQRLQ
jgi:YggT family protein